MSGKELERKSYVERVVEGRLNLRAMAKVIKLSYRQAQRVVKRYREEGDAGLLHKSRGRPSNRGISQGKRKKMLARYEERYQGFGPTFASEKLEEEGLKVDHETLRRWLIKEGWWQRKRKRGRHRERRERRRHLGELVQIDGSHHPWWGEEKSCLINLVDDATSQRLGVMAQEESTRAVMQALWEWIKKYGIPLALYADRKNVFLTDRQPTVEESLAGQTPLTAFGLACRKLGIEIIPSHSPQGKGRVERAHGTDQDRLVKEFQLRGIQTLSEANRFLKQKYYKQINRKFSVSPTESLDYHRPVPDGLKLEEVFCWEETRTVQKDWTVRFETQCLQILKQNNPLPRPGQKIIVRRLLNDQLQLVLKGQPLQWKILSSALPLPVALPSSQTRRSRAYKPSENHPWRRSRLKNPSPHMPSTPSRNPVSCAVAATAAPVGA
jgi:transposase